MLRLKQIDLYGFKSFCNRERLRFSGSGIAAIVGPNGCGKSNICDAISWVLGEQSAKSLRGSRMHDVIFSGTNKRNPAGMASVTLSLHDPDETVKSVFQGNGHGRRTPVPLGKTPGEITVARKLFSSGESHYILNGKVVRLRDVQDLFLGTGLGPNHYAIIEQGRIGQLLSARPLDRRVFVEEAAGVTRFKARRKLAELKLVNANLNLERVHDILREIQRQADSLKRQAARAERYELYQEQLRAAQSLVFASRFRQIDADRIRLEEEVEEGKAHLQEVSAETERMESEFSEKRGLEQHLETQLEAARDELSGLRIDEERMRERVEQQSRAAADSTVRWQQASHDLQTVSRRLEELKHGADSERQNVAAIAHGAEQLQLRLGDKELECTVQEAAMADLQAQEGVCRSRLLETLNAISHEREHLGKLDETLATQERQLKRESARMKDTLEQLDQASERGRQQGSQVEALRGKLADKAARRETLQGVLAERRSQLEAVRRQAEDQRAEISRLSARRDSLREVLAHRAFTTEAVQDFFDAIEKGPHAGFRPLGILADFLEVDEGYEKLVEQFLGDELEYVVVADWEEAGRGVQLVREEFDGRAAFLVRSGPNVATERFGPELEHGDAERLMDHVRLVPRKGDAPPGTLPKLRDGYLMRDAVTAQRLAALHPERYFLLPDGTWYRGNTVQIGRKASSGPLVLKQQLRDLIPKLQEAERGLRQLELDLESAEDAVQRDSAELETVRSGLQDLEKHALAVEHDLRQTDQRIGELEATLHAAGEEAKRLEGEEAHCARQRNQAISQRLKLDSLYAKTQARSVELSGQSRECQTLLARLQEERTTLRTEAAALDERRRAGEASQMRMEALLAEQSQRRADAQRQIEQWQLESRCLLQDNAGLEDRIARVVERQRDLRLRIGATTESLRDLRTQLGTLVETLREQRGRVEEARSECSTKEIELARVQADLEHLAESCTAELGERVSAVVGRVSEDLTPEALREAEEQQRSVKETIERLGPVNVLARKEYEQVAQRLHFLESQQQDLLDSIGNTRQAIREIDAASREKFDRAFESINGNFRQVFATLFGGGLGEMRLTDPANAEESGIDIVAQPPGKRLQNVALLSGGEKSLTVMALLMATFRYKPSPFCILDEVDSQLDEANTVRFRRLLQDMAPETQFIVITHSKTTMEVAETLYGVTMSEAGVSKLVSVRMANSQAVATPQVSSVEAPMALSA